MPGDLVCCLSDGKTDERCCVLSWGVPDLAQSNDKSTSLTRVWSSANERYDPEVE